MGGKALILFLLSAVSSFGQALTGGLWTNYTPLVYRHLTNTTSTANASVYASTAFLPTEGALVLAAVVTTGTATIGNHVLMSSNLQWTLIASNKYDTIAAPTHNVSLWAAKVIGPMLQRQIVTNATSAAMTGCASTIVEFTGIDTNAAWESIIIQTNLTTANSGANPSVTMTRELLRDSVNMLYSVWADNTNPYGQTPQNPFIEAADHGFSTPTAGLASMYRLAHLQQTVFSTNADTDTASITIEVMPRKRVRTSTQAPPATNDIVIRMTGGVNNDTLTATILNASTYGAFASWEIKTNDSPITPTVWQRVTNMAPFQPTANSLPGLVPGLTARNGDGYNVGADFAWAYNCRGEGEWVELNMNGNHTNVSVGFDLMIDSQFDTTTFGSYDLVTLKADAGEFIVVNLGDGSEGDNTFCSIQCHTGAGLGTPIVITSNTWYRISVLWARPTAVATVQVYKYPTAFDDSRMYHIGTSTQPLAADNMSNLRIGRTDIGHGAATLKTQTYLTRNYGISTNGARWPNLPAMANQNGL